MKHRIQVERSIQKCMTWLLLIQQEQPSLLLSSLPESILIQILFRLPIESVFRFKSVSKHWLSLISDPSFARSYYSHINKLNNNNQPWTLLYRYNNHINLTSDDLWLHLLEHGNPIFKSICFTLRFLSNNFKLPTYHQQTLAEDSADDGKAPVIVYAVSNGLLLSTVTRFWHKSYYIINPFTKKYYALPKPPRIHKWVSLGFIVEPIDGSFQVVRIGEYQGPSNVVNFEIFSSKTGQWEDKKASFHLPVSLFLSRIMYTHLHAISCKRILYWMEYRQKMIVYDTEEEVEKDETIRCSLIDLPGDSDIHDKASVGSIGVCQDHVHYSYSGGWPLNQSFSVCGN